MEGTQKLFKKIDQLSKAKSLETLTKRLQKILRIMAYHVSQSESATNDHHEGWRETFAATLRSEVGRKP